MSYLIVQIYDRNKVVKIFILSNIDIHDQTSRMHRHPGVAKISRLEKFKLGFDKSDTDILDLIIECFSRDKSCHKGYFKQLICR